MELHGLIRERYPREFVLRNGARVSVRPLVREDKDALLSFFRSLPEEDRLYLKDDVTSEQVIREWCEKIHYQSVLPLLAFKKEQVVADATLHQRALGWNRHVGNIRAVVHPEVRGVGLGSILVQEIVEIAQRVGLKKLDVELMEVQEDAIHVFESLGFHQIALLPQHVTDIKGNFHDLVILAKDLRFEATEDYFAGD